MIAALFVETDGTYYGHQGIDPWDEQRDARLYNGPHPVIAHPPCERWGRFWHGSPSKPHQFRKGEDQGCFASALTSVRNYGGVLEHPKDSHAWDWFGLEKPVRGNGWTDPDAFGGRSCVIDQGNYGHIAKKATWLYAVLEEYPELNWTECEQRIDQDMVEKMGYAKARRMGVISRIGGKDKKKKRNATPAEFRDILINCATKKPIYQ